tara:strand:- start:1886 stop:2704 length:819 start_codon:yes stop_codon:yes gene_type:complete
MITKEQNIFYRENGYLIVENVLPENECDNYLSQIKKHANSDFAAIMNPDRFDFLVAQSLENIVTGLSLSDRVEHVEECRKTAQATFEIMANKTAVSILEELQNTKIVGLMSQMLFKEANTRYASQAWNPHQDNIYPQNNSILKNGFTTQYLTTNFFLNDANKDNGSLYIYPGSHKKGLFNAEVRTSYRENKDSNPGNKIPEKYLKQFEKVDCSFNKGDLLVLNGNCIHGSYANNSNISRPLLSVSYISDSESFIPGKNAKRKVISLEKNRNE